MALKVKAKERLQKIGKYAGTYRYVMLPELYNSLSQEKVIREAALRSGVSEGVMQACWDAAGEVIKAWATEGHSVALPGLGTMRFSLSAKSVADVNEVKTSLIRTRRIIFTPAMEVKNELRDTSINITCYDRDGNVVKQVTSADPGVVEDNGENQNENQNENGGSGSQGSGSQTSLTAPSISGTTPFAESTSVTMSGPDGAEIRYTTDGSTPTSSSSLYSSALNLSATTTVKAIAIKDGQSSEVTTKVFTKSSGGGDAD